MLDYASVLALRLTGLSYRKIGAQVGVSGQRIQQFLSPDPEVKDVVIARRLGRCEGCNAPAGATGHIHHRAIEGMTPEAYSAPENLTLLCRDCHLVAHTWPAHEQSRPPRKPRPEPLPRGYRNGAAALGVSVAEYTAHRDAGERWCSYHRRWEPQTAFPPYRPSGKCVEANRAASREYARRITDTGVPSPHRSLMARQRQGASRLGISVEDYVAQIQAGRWWCSFHRGWEPQSHFGANKRRPDGRDPSCRVAQQERNRQQRERRSA